MSMLTDERELKELLKERFQSRDWWFFIPIGYEAIDYVSDIEEKFYDGEKNGDFHSFMGGYHGGFFSIFTGRKSTLPRVQLEAWVNDVLGIELPEDNDLLFFAEPGAQLSDSVAAQFISDAINE